MRNRPAVRTAGGEVGFIHAAQQFIHLADFQRVNAAHYRMAGDSGEQFIQHILKSGAGAELDEISQDIPYQAKRVSFGCQSRDCGDHKGVAAEWFQLETETGQILEKTRQLPQPR